MQTHLPIDTVKKLHAIFEGDNARETAILNHIAKKYGARNLFFLPEDVAARAIAMPKSFLKEAQENE